jgi:hypothetical protein
MADDYSFDFAGDSGLGDVPFLSGGETGVDFSGLDSALAGFGGIGEAGSGFGTPSFNTPMAQNPFFSPVQGQTNLPGLPPTGPKPYQAPIPGMNPGPQMPQMPGGPSGLQMGIGGLLGAGGAGLGLIGSLLGNKQQGMTVPQKAIGTQAQQAASGMQPFAQGQTPLQQQQAAMLGQYSQYMNQLMGGGAGMQANINALSPLIQQAYQPFMDNAYRNATQAGQRAGFYDAAATSPAGNRIMSQAISDAQGQEAGSLLQALLQQMPGAYSQAVGSFNQPVQQQIGAQQGMGNQYGSLFSNYPQYPQAPSAFQIAGQGLGNMFQQGAQGVQQVQNQYNQQQQQAQAQQQQAYQNQLNQYMLRQIQGPQGGQSSPNLTGMAGVYDIPGVS